MVDDLTKLAQGKNIAAVTTLHADGTPLTHPMWIDADDEYLILNTEVGRHRFCNLNRDPRVTVAIWDGIGGDLYREVRGAFIGDARGVAVALAIAAAIGFAAAHDSCVRNGSNGIERFNVGGVDPLVLRGGDRDRHVGQRRSLDLDRSVRIRFSGFAPAE